MDNQLIIKGKQEFLGKQIPIVYGGFGENQKCVSDKTVDEIHNTPVTEIRRRITENIKRFKENIDFIDFKQRMDDTHTLELLQQMGYSKQAITQANHIYLLSERGYAKLIKIMDTDLAWEIHDKLIDEYFEIREQQTKQKEKRIESIEAINQSANIILSTLSGAGIEMEPIHKVYLLKQLYRKADVEIPDIRVEQQTMLYDKEMIAKKLGVLSTNKKPHTLAISGIIQKLDIAKENIVITSYEKHGHTGVIEQYRPVVLEQIKEWLNNNNYPTKISYTDSNNNIKNCTVFYEMESDVKNCSI